MATSKEALAFSQSIDSAARLYLQHWMCTYETGFLAHPKIPLDQENLRIADVACGTGIWLVDLARSVPASTKLDGYDISSAHFPPKEWLPRNVNLQLLDANKDVPEHLIGTYDVVHIGRIVLFIRNEDPSKLLKNFMSLLKPGGYLYWDELDLGSLRPRAINDGISHPCCDKMDTLGTSWLKQNGVTTRWVNEMDKSFEQVGMTVLDYQRCPVGKAMTQPWTLMQLMANRDFIENDIIPSCEGDPSRPQPEEWRRLEQGIAHECSQGVSLTMDIVYILGQKP